MKDPLRHVDGTLHILAILVCFSAELLVLLGLLTSVTYLYVDSAKSLNCLAETGFDL